jgi:hypothetical protein
MEDFPQAASGEQQEAKGRCSERIDLGEPIFGLGYVFGRRLGFIYIPGNALRLGLANG